LRNALVPLGPQPRLLEMQAAKRIADERTTAAAGADSVLPQQLLRQWLP
jgi:hypothetical protein